MKKPMLAADAAEATLRFPLYASTKLDGIRGVVVNGQILSRNGKPIRNRFVQKWFKAHPELENLDGELIVGPANANDVYRQTSSGVMSEDGEPNFVFFVFDRVDMPSVPFAKRYQNLITNFKSGDRIFLVEEKLIKDEAELVKFEEQCLAAGYEGLILRTVNSPYKFGRSSAREGYMLKLKRFSDAEAEVVGFMELLSNQNPKTRDKFGDSERSSHKENMIPQGTLGALTCLHTNGMEFGIGTGFDDKTRQEIWNNRKKYLGKLVKYKHFDCGVKDVPRFPVFLGWRDKSDL